MLWRAVGARTPWSSASGSRLHTGAAFRADAEESPASKRVGARDGDTFGPVLNRVASLLAVVHGGQILLSGATRELVQDALPPDVSLRDLGRHRLRDLRRPERLFQLLHPDLPNLPLDLSEMPQLNTLGAQPINLHKYDQLLSGGT